MHAKTRSTLLGLGFDTELIDSVAKNHHTVSALRKLSKAALAGMYTPAQIAAIQAKIARQPIPADAVTRVLNAAGSACCYCEDGITVRPYQIHHVQPYSSTQDHSDENLLVVCPNHHIWIHQTKIPTAQQKHARRKWQALVALAERYKTAGVSFPFGSFVGVDYIGQPSAVELIREIRVTPATAVAVSAHAVADEVRERVLRDRFALLLGRSGDGKTTIALGVAGRLASEGWHVFRYRPPATDTRAALQEILAFLATAVRNSVLILDDANTWLTTHDLEDVAGAVSDTAAVIATWTRDRGGDDNRVEAHLPRWVSAEWSKLSPSVMAFFSAYETDVVGALRSLEPPNAVRPIGLDMFSEALADRMRRYAAAAKTVAEFLFMLRGGADVVRKELLDLIERDRADLPVLYAAVEQIADFERPVTPEETAQSLAALDPDRTLPTPSPGWVTDVYERERVRRRIQRRRHAYTTIHREWAKRLICAALGERTARAGVKAILARDFDAHTARPLRTMRLWSWLWYDKLGTPFVREWAASLKTEDWISFVATSAAENLDLLGSVADRMHLLLRNANWDATVGTVFGALRESLAKALAGATAESWGALKSLFMTLNHACQAVAAEVLRTWPAETAAEILQHTRPDYYDAAWWFVSGVKTHSPDWVAAVGRHIDWSALYESLTGVRPGDLGAVSCCHSLLAALGVPLTRSRLRQFVDVMARCLSTCSLSELRPGFGCNLEFVLAFYPTEIQRLTAAIDVRRFARELATSSPRQWRPLLDLCQIVPPNGTDVYGQLIDTLDKDLFATTVARFGSLCPYELRCLIWFLAYAAKGEARKQLASRLALVLKRACLTSKSERGSLLEAMTALDEHVARTVALELPPIPPEAQSEQPKHDDKEHKPAIIETWRRLVEQAESTGDDYDVTALFGLAE